MKPYIEPELLEALATASASQEFSIAFTFEQKTDVRHLMDRVEDEAKLRSQALHIFPNLYTAHVCAPKLVIESLLRRDEVHVACLID